MLSRVSRIRRVDVKSVAGRLTRSFSIHSPHLEKPLPPRIVIPEKDIVESFLKGTGPGGQKINKTSSAVQLKHIPTGIVVKNQGTRSREQNRKDARRILGEKVEELEQTPRWAATQIKGDKIRKKKASAAKKSRRKYRDLEAAAAEAGRARADTEMGSHAGQRRQDPEEEGQCSEEVEEEVARPGGSCSEEVEEEVS